MIDRGLWEHMFDADLFVHSCRARSGPPVDHRLMGQKLSCPPFSVRAVRQEKSM